MLPDVCMRMSTEKIFQSESMHIPPGVPALALAALPWVAVAMFNQNKKTLNIFIWWHIHASVTADSLHSNRASNLIRKIGLIYRGVSEILSDTPAVPKSRRSHPASPHVDWTWLLLTMVGRPSFPSLDVSWRFNTPPHPSFNLHASPSSKSIVNS